MGRLLRYRIPLHVLVAGVRDPTRGEGANFEWAVETDPKPGSELLVVSECPPHTRNRCFEFDDLFNSILVRFGHWAISLLRWRLERALRTRSRLVALSSHRHPSETRPIGNAGPRSPKMSHHGVATGIPHHSKCSLRARFPSVRCSVIGPKAARTARCRPSGRRRQGPEVETTGGAGLGLLG